MGSPRRYNQTVDPFQEASRSNYSTSYRGAEGSLDLPPAVHVDRDGYEDIRLNDRTRTSPVREGFGSRILSNAQPAAAALARSGSVLHTRARSWAAYVPKLNTNSSTTSTPEKQDTAHKPRPQSRLFENLFNGDSAPVQLGVPTSPTKEKEKDELETEFVMEYRSGFTERPRTARRDSAKTPTQPPANTRKTSSSWFSRKASTPTPAPAASKPVDDEMLNVNINSALFPHGPADPLSPQAFNDLLLNANSLLQRMQAAYKEKAEYIASIQPEIDAQKEEVDEARTRSEHLKMQLEDIGRKQEEQRQVNEELIIQLSKEKMKVQELQEQARSTIRLVRRDTGQETECEDSTDDDAQRRRKRSSGGSASDSGFESDADTASVFSAGVETPRSGMSGSIQPRVVVTLDHQSQPQVRYASSRDSRISQQSTVFSRGSGMGKQAEGSTLTAWATVERLRGENAQLRGQVEAMQSSLQGVIDFVGDVKVV